MTDTTTQEYAIRERSTGRRIEVATLDDALAECSRRGRGWYLDAPPTQGDRRETKGTKITLPRRVSDTRGLAKARTRAGLTREEVAEMLGVAATSIRQWETHDVPAYRRAELLELYREVRPGNKAGARGSGARHRATLASG